MGSKVSSVLGVAIALTVAAGQIAAAQRGQAMRFQGMDRNNDGRITRAEWNGSDQSFRVHDWNGDGVLSGDEVRPGGRRAARQQRDDDFGEIDREYQFNDWTARGFASLDHNRDNKITVDEWHFDREGFRRADHNRDGAISRGEFLSEDAQDEDDDREDRFVDLDTNRDNRISRAEWHGTARSFDILDDNRDGMLTRVEVFGTEAPPDLFTSVDVNRNGTIARDEWHWSRASFDRLDKNRDGRLTREEYAGTIVGTTGVTRSPAYQAGHERGLIEGRAAGREDRVRNQGWDLEGQRELEQADSGYQPQIGARTDYQAGYREAFRVAYREGFANP
jgi:Ca2+-binding EF-hand superfamily protein